MLDAINGGLIVSCQALSDEPLHSPEIMAKMALAAKMGGAIGIRANSVIDIKAIKKAVDLPVIGLIKREYEGSDVFITPTKKEVTELAESGCEMIATDATIRNRPNNEDLQSIVDLIHEKGLLALADISSLEEAIIAEKMGFDCVSTTLAGYTSYTRKTKGPDYKILKKAVKRLNIPVIAEGRITQIKEIKKVYKLKPHSIVIGSAITRPQVITKMFVDAISK